MCTLIALHRCVPGRPLVIAANRDEFFGRPAEGPALRMRGNGPVLSPLDLEAGGTWLGLNGQGLFVGLTNLRPETEGSVPRSAAEVVAMAERSDGPVGRPGARSRGEVVMAALDAGSAADAAAIVGGLEAEAYNPFQLLIADAEQAWLTVYRDKPRTRALEPGVHVVGNVEEEGIDEVVLNGSSPLSIEAQLESEEPRARKLTRIRERVEGLRAERDHDLLSGLGAVCREHVETNPFESTCVHVADRYGTRSSLLLELAEEAQASRLWATDGPPCERSFEDLSGMLGELDVMSKAHRARR